MEYEGYKSMERLWFHLKIKFCSFFVVKSDCLVALSKESALLMCGCVLRMEEPTCSTKQDISAVSYNSVVMLIVHYHFSCAL